MDFSDPNDRAFDLATTRNFGINDAREYAGATDTISYQGLYQRVRRWKDTQQLLEKEEAAAQTLATLSSVRNDTAKGGTSSTASATPRSNTAMKGAKRGRVTPPSDLGIATFDKSPIPIGKKDVDALDVSIELMPDWVGKEKLKGNVGKQTRRSHKAAYHHNWRKRAKKDRRDARYKKVCKKATTEAWKIKHKRGAAGKKANGLKSIASRYNELYLAELDDRRLTKQAIHQCINVRGEHGVSPPKRGAPFKPKHPELTSQVALQAAMNQAAGAGEATSRMLKNAVEAATAGTEHEGRAPCSMAWSPSRTTPLSTSRQY